MSMTIDSGRQAAEDGVGAVALGERAHHLHPEAHAVARLHAPGVDHAAQREDARAAGRRRRARRRPSISRASSSGARRRAGRPAPAAARGCRGGGGHAGVEVLGLHVLGGDAGRLGVRRAAGTAPPALAGARGSRFCRPESARRCSGHRGEHARGRSRRRAPCPRRARAARRRCCSGRRSPAVDLVAAEQRPVGLGGLGVHPLLLEQPRGVRVVARGRVLAAPPRACCRTARAPGRRAGGRPCCGRSSRPRCSSSSACRCRPRAARCPSGRAAAAARSSSPAGLPALGGAGAGP